MPRLAVEFFKTYAEESLVYFHDGRYNECHRKIFFNQVIIKIKRLLNKQPIVI